MRKLMKMEMPERGEKGFTLIELLIVIAILAILAAIVIPSVMGAFGRGAAQAFEGDMDSIQSMISEYWWDNGGGSTAWPTYGADNAAAGGDDGTLPGTIDWDLDGAITGDDLVPVYVTEVPDSWDTAHDGDPATAAGGHYSWAINTDGLVGYWCDTVAYGGDGDGVVDDAEILFDYDDTIGYP